MRANYDLLVIGDVNADLILTDDDPVPVFGQVEKLVDEGLLTVGGSYGITASAAARLGLNTACIGVVGDDAIGALLRSALSDRGVDVSACPVDATRRTGITVVLTSHGKTDRAMLTALGTISALTADQVDRAVLRRSRHLHCGAYFLQPDLQPQLASLFTEARAMGVTCSLDTNWDPSRRWDGGLASVLPLCDLFFPNESEALDITGCAGVEAAAGKLAAAGPAVAVKRGGAGAIVCVGGRTLRASAPRVDLVDTTGAGDAFNAGYLFGFISGWEAEQCLSFAVACGSLSTRGLGGVEGLATLDEAQWLASRVEVTVA